MTNSPSPLDDLFESIFSHRHRERLSKIKIKFWRVINKRRIPMGVPATVSVGHEVICTIAYYDQNGNPMLTAVTPDKAPVWTDTPSVAGVDSNAVSADGLTDVVNALAAGTDTVGVSVVVGGKTYTDSALLTVTPAPQALTSVAIQTQVQ
jgi:hypothetical protein